MPKGYNASRYKKYSQYEQNYDFVNHIIQNISFVRLLRIFKLNLFKSVVELKLEILKEFNVKCVRIQLGYFDDSEIEERGSFRGLNSVQISKFSVKTTFICSHQAFL